MWDGAWSTPVVRVHCFVAHSERVTHDACRRVPPTPESATPTQKLQGRPNWKGGTR